MSRPVYTTFSKAVMVIGLIVALLCIAAIESSTRADAVASVPVAERVAIPEQSARYRIALEREAAAQFGLDAPVARVAGQIHQESLWDASAESPFAQGLAQFTPSTAHWLPDVCPDVGPPDTWDAAWSLRAITCYDRYLYDRLNAASECDRWAFTLSAYNGGLGMLNRERTRASTTGVEAARWFEHVERFSARSRPAFAENRAYVRRILYVLEPSYVAAGWPGEVVCP